MDEDDWHPPVVTVVVKQQQEDKILSIKSIDFDEDEDDWHPPQQSEEMRQRSEVFNDEEEVDDNIRPPQVKPTDADAHEEDDDWHPSQQSTEIQKQADVIDDVDDDKIIDIVVVTEHIEQSSKQLSVSTEDIDDTTLLQQVTQLSLANEEEGEDVDQFDEDDYDDDDDDSNMSDISDHFEGDAHLLEVNIGGPLTNGTVQAPVLSLDEVSYSRDLKSINKPAEDHGKLIRNGSNRLSSSRLLEVDGGRGTGRMDDRDGNRRDRRRGRRDGNLTTVVISASDQLLESGASRGPGKLVVFDDDPKPSQRRRRVREPRGDRGVDAPSGNSRRERGGNEGGAGGAGGGGGGSSHGDNDRRRGSGRDGRHGRSRNGGGGGGGGGRIGDGGGSVGSGGSGRGDRSSGGNRGGMGNNGRHRGPVTVMLNSSSQHRTTSHHQQPSHPYYNEILHNVAGDDNDMYNEDDFSLPSHEPHAFHYNVAHDGGGSPYHHSRTTHEGFSGSGLAPGQGLGYAPSSLLTSSRYGMQGGAPHASVGTSAPSHHSLYPDHNNHSQRTAQLFSSEYSKKSGAPYGVGNQMLHMPHHHHQQLDDEGGHETMDNAVRLRAGD